MMIEIETYNLKILMEHVDPKNTTDAIWRYTDLFKLFIMYWLLMII